MSDAVFVLAQRAKGRSWQSISAMTGRSEHSLRMEYDKGYVSPYPTAKAAPAPAPAAEVVEHRAYEKRHAVNSSDMALLGLMVQVGDWIALKNLPAGSHMAIYRLRKHHGQNVVESMKGWGYRATDKGRAVWAKNELKGVKAPVAAA